MFSKKQHREEPFFFENCSRELLAHSSPGSGAQLLFAFDNLMLEKNDGISNSIVTWISASELFFDFDILYVHRLAGLVYLTRFAFSQAM